MSSSHFVRCFFFFFFFSLTAKIVSSFNSQLSHCYFLHFTQPFSLPPFFSRSKRNKFAFLSLQSSLTGSKPSNLERGRPGESLSRRIHVCNPRASHFIAGSLKACLMRCPKWKIALIDHPNTILCLPQANSGLSVLVKLVFVSLFPPACVLLFNTESEAEGSLF